MPEGRQVIKRAGRALAIVALTTLVGCNPQTSPATSTMPNAVVLRLSSTDATTILLRDLSMQYQTTNPALSFETSTSNDKTIRRDILNGSPPYALTNHLPTDNSLWAAPIARDGLAVIVHPRNPITQLTTEQIRDIYQGNITYWQDLDGSNRRITVLSREDGSGTRAEFERLVMGQRRTTANAQVVASSRAMLARVQQQAESIGYIPLSLLEETVDVLAINGVTPSFETITEHTYPLRLTIYMIGLAEPDHHSRAFVGWIQSMEGQAVVAQDYIPLP